MVVATPRKGWYHGPSGGLMPPKLLEVAAVNRRGSYATLTLRGEFFPSHPGQFYMLKGAWGLQPFLARPISILGESPEREEIRFLVKGVGEGSRLLCAAEPNQRLESIGPLGTSFPCDFASGETAVLVGGGVGVPPLVYLAERLAARGVKVRFLQGARTEDDLLLRDELQANGADLQATTEDGTAGTKGLVTTLLEAELAARPAALCACGPEGMIRAVGRACLGRVPCYLSLEAQMGCGYGVCLSCVTQALNGEGKVVHHRICKEGPVFKAEVLPWL